jgi:glycosyltransferase involved in cell wall biosynthesis
MNCLVSILIPAFNAEQWISQSILAATSQTWPHKEVIVVDDGSTDRTLEIAKRFESRTLKVVTQSNAGACAARNAAFSLAQGDYVQWLDADDLLHPEKIARQMARAAAGDPLALHTAAWGRFFFRIEKTRFAPDALWCDLAPVDWILTKLGGNVWMNPACWLMSRRLAELAGGWDERLRSGDDDGEYICRVVRRSTRVVFVPDAYAYYRIGTVGSLNWNRERSERTLRGLSLSMVMQIAHLRSLEDSDRTRAACLRYLENFLTYFYGMDESHLVQLREVAAELGGQLPSPRISWKYYPLEKLFGHETARKVMDRWRATKLLVRRRLDKCLYDMAV